MELGIIPEKELLELLGINKAALYRLRKEKGLPYVSLTRVERVYPVDKFMEWISKNCQSEEGGFNESD